MAITQFFQSLQNRFTSLLTPIPVNQFNRAFYSWVGGNGTSYDVNGKTYIEQGYNNNADVYAIVNQIAKKASSVPFFIRKTENESKARQLMMEVKQDQTQAFAQFVMRKKQLEKKAFETVEGNDSYLPPPFPRPNPHQSWTEFFELSETFLKLTGNLYWYMPPILMGADAGEPFAIYCLPSHLMEIVLKRNADLLIDSNPVDYYMLIQSGKYTEFDARDVVHITYSNPNFDFNGSHLYGQSPLRSALDEIATANEGNKQNVKTMKNAGSYGFIHGKQIPLQVDQAKELKDRLHEMDNDPGRLGRIAGISTDIGFTRLSLTTDELKPFDFLTYSQKQLCNVLGWSDKLLNNDQGAKYDNVNEFRKQVITDTIAPDLGLMEEAWNTEILPRFKAYKNTIAYFDFSLLPEMQVDQKIMVEWLTVALADGVINRNEYREALSLEGVEGDEFNHFTVQMGLLPLKDAIDTPMDISITERVTQNVTDGENKSRWDGVQINWEAFE